MVTLNHLSKMNTKITHQMVVDACEAADLIAPQYYEDTGDMMRRAEWRVNRPRLARLLQDAVNDGPGMASRNEDAVCALRIIWTEHKVPRCASCGGLMRPSDPARVCDSCADEEDAAVERAQDRQIARFEQW